MAKKSNHLKQKPEKPKKAPKAPKAPIEIKNSDSLLLLRLVAATVIFAVSLILDVPDFVSILMLALAVVAAGFDIILEAVNSVQKQDYFATPVVVIVVAVLSFVIGFGMEGAALVILYQIGLWLINYATERTKKSALELVRYQDEDINAKVSQIIDQPTASETDIEKVMKQSSSFVLKIAMVIAVIYAVVLPLATSFSYVVSIHRALTIILIATPMSVVVSIPLSAMVGICYSAGEGVVFNDARSMEKADLANIAVFDKAGVFAEKTPRVLSVQSDMLDQNTLMNFAAHAVYYSEQPIAKAISAINEQDYKLEVISDFRDIPGYGVDLKIGGADVTLATRELFASRGVEVPFDEAAAGQAFYMTVSNRYVGKLVISSDIDTVSAGVPNELKSLGIKRVILLTDDGDVESQRVADELDIKEVYGECTTEKKLELIKNLKEGSRNRVLYVYSNGIEAHSAADVDIRVSKKGKYADGVVVPGNVNNIPFSIQVCRREKEVAISNALFAFIVKAILIFLSIVGYCNIWFAIFIDMAAAIGTILNAFRVTTNSLVNTLKYKTGK